MKLKYFPLQKVSYSQAELLQQSYARLMLDAKKTKSPMPDPAIFAFEMNPVYTCGRRQVGNIDQSLIDHFLDGGKAEFVETQRGGHVTFHGPGQLVLYPIFDLTSMGVKVRDYMCKLEGGVIDLLKLYGLEGKRTHDTGVWLDDKRKICSMGIHVRRGVTSHGIGLNVKTDNYWFDRIVACNLPDAKMVSIGDYAKDVDITTVCNELTEIYRNKFNLS